MIPIRLQRGEWSFDPGEALGAPGGFGTVFRGRGADGSEVAVKRLHIDAKEAAHRELRMAQELSKADLQHVMPILDSGQDALSDGYFIVMPVASGSLQDLLATQGQMSEFESVAVLREVAAGLAEVPGLVHRDLKPANVLRLDGRWCIADFGIARFVEESTSAHTLKNCLSPQYAAPEQWRFERATSATDVYALGCVAYALLSGRPPFSGSMDQLQDQHLHAAPPELADRSPQVKALLAMTLRKPSDARPSLSRVIQILDSISQQVGVPSDTALQKLAAAAALQEREDAAKAAAEAKTRTMHATRVELAGAATRTLRGACDQIAARVGDSVPTATIKRSATNLQVSVGSATLVVDWQASGHVFAVDSWPRSGWDVICGAVVEVVQGNTRYKRAANLWYTRQKNPGGDFRWYEVGYEGNVMAGRSFEFEPAAVNAELADRAHWTGMDIVQASYGPFAIDDEDVDGFCARWIHVLAEACAGHLKRVPRALSARGPY